MSVILHEGIFPLSPTHHFKGIQVKHYLTKIVNGL